MQEMGFETMGCFGEMGESNIFDRIEDLNVDLPGHGKHGEDEWLDLVRSEFEMNVMRQVLKPEAQPSNAMRRCGSVPAHMQYQEAKASPVFPKVSSVASFGSQRNLASMCSEVTMTPTSSVPDLVDFERRQQAMMDRQEMGPDGMPQMVSVWSREEALMRYKRKKANRCFRKKIRYECRRKIASDRPRVGGRFARTDGDNNDVDDMNKYVNLEIIPSL